MLKDRFRKFLPVVVDLETGGFDAINNPILEIAIQLIDFEGQQLVLGDSHRHHIKPHEGLEINQESIDFLNLDLNHPLRVAVDEKSALLDIFKVINKHRNLYECSRAILVGHNAFFDHSFLLAACDRHDIKKSPFHPFSLIDTVSLGVLATQQTVLARICKELDIDYDNEQAHSAAYDAKVTAEAFCKIVNQFDERV
ncbi:exonuclease domain-containing protein [Gammaproteobacteria bacterium]|nr:exonuclease domain-containing protein [Gammaproteobacteria bacterium]MDA8720096.1 exonuclease domain-containing protein [bacterium]MDA9048427.1 exonuclease domain-containing protein [Gammaproteobacteria bacterium]MDA9340412.1 exonuclease domain-containing protein [Gammaproteobacteria bacterium]MDB9700561.1 exonuclease domain-containing protein [Gammaproteobacteria bacterium]|tara:strand:+ start:242 stop:832 length:591 start_codon:yes stop_codon:yes gene_type:complete